MATFMLTPISWINQFSCFQLSFTVFGQSIGIVERVRAFREFGLVTLADEDQILDEPGCFSAIVARASALIRTISSSLDLVQDVI